MDEPAETVRKVLLRIGETQLAEIDARADRVGLSRNAWILKALEWAVAQPTRTVAVTTKQEI